MNHKGEWKFILFNCPYELICYSLNLRRGEMLPSQVGWPLKTVLVWTMNQMNSVVLGAMSQSGRVPRRPTIGPGSLAHISARWWLPSACAGTSSAAATLGSSSGSEYRQPSTCLPSIFLGRPLDRHGKRSLSYQTGICPCPVFGRNCILRSRNKTI